MGIISSKLIKKSVAIGVIIIVILAGGALWWYSDGTKGYIGATTVIGVHIVDAETNSEMWSRDMSLEKPSFLQMLGLHKQQYLLNTYDQTIDVGFNRSY